MLKTELHFDDSNNSVLLHINLEKTNFQGRGNVPKLFLVAVFIAVLVGILTSLEINKQFAYVSRSKKPDPKKIY